ncbi:hypothetical protein RND81_07G110600 [Saponaria officinalis]|uniref:ENTH domain-containing protein n=1 Tax=Saponaria officinalis TaxID=3572 RepID=A0AAW1JT06_SAPOF
MAPSKRIRRAMGVVKDKTRISIAKVASNLDPEIDILIVKATSHDDVVPNDKIFEEILVRSSSSKELVIECVGLVCKRIERTRDWIVALKCLILIHRLVIDGGEVFVEEIACANASNVKGGGMLSNMCVFKDEAHPNSWDYTEFVRRYGMYLDEKVELMVFDNMCLRRRMRFGVSDGLNELGEKESRDEVSVLSRMEQLQRMLERVLAMRPRTVSKHQKLVILALCPVVEESFKLYDDICEGLSYLLDKFWGMEYWNVVKSLGTYVTVAKQIDELVEFYAWCKDFGVVTNSEYLVVERISDDLLRTMESFMKNKAVEFKNQRKKKNESSVDHVSLQQKEQESSISVTVRETESVSDDDDFVGVTVGEMEPVSDDDNFVGVTVGDVEPISDDFVGQFQELINLKDDEVPEEDHGEKLALALFSDNQTNINPWENVSNSTETTKITRENETSDWELALVESASNLNKQKPELGGGFDDLLLDSLYNQKTVSNTANCSPMIMGGNAVLALPSPNGPLGPLQVVEQDPFAASVAVPPPMYVQIAEMEKQQRLMMHEQQVWQQYGTNGMQGQSSLAQLNNNGFSTNYAFGPQTMMPYEIPGNSVQPTEATGHHYYPWTN